MFGPIGHTVDRTGAFVGGTQRQDKAYGLWKEYQESNPIPTPINKGLIELNTETKQDEVGKHAAKYTTVVA